MNSKQIERYLMRFLDVMNCSVLEKTATSVLVKLSPEADKELTGRSYYWGFIERTGEPAETMTMRFVFDPVKEAEAEEAARNRTNEAAMAKLPPGAHGLAPSTASSTPAEPLGADGNSPLSDSILGRYLNVQLPHIGSRVPTDTVSFGSRRLEQIFQVVRRKGSYVRLFEERKKSAAPLSTPYSTWLCVNYKIELTSDMKREEMHSLGVDLGSGQIVTDFWEKMKKRKLDSRIPSGIFLKPTKLTLNRAATALEAHLEKLLKTYDHTWAEEARLRLADELLRLDSYYENLIAGMQPVAVIREAVNSGSIGVGVSVGVTAAKRIGTSEEVSSAAVQSGHAVTVEGNVVDAEALAEQRLAEARQEYRMRREEAEWQYMPRIAASAVNCGLFHLSAEDAP